MTPGVGRILTVAAERYPDREAVVDGARRTSYRALDARVNRVARGLRDLGIGRGDHVALLLKNREEHVVVYWACQKLGAVATPLSWRYAEAEVRFCVEDAEAAAVVFEPACGAAALAARPALPGVRAWIHAGAEPPAGSTTLEALAAGDEDPGPPPAVVDESDTSIMLYTSGTTGRPKGVPRSHRAEASAAIAHAVQSRNALGERTLGVMPLYHTMGVRSMIAMAMLSGTLVCLPDWSPAAAARLIQDERITALYLVPTLYHDLVHHERFRETDVSSVRKIGFAGASMTDGGRVLRQWPPPHRGRPAPPQTCDACARHPRQRR